MGAGCNSILLAITFQTSQDTRQNDKKANYECVKLITKNLYLNHGFNNRKYVENIIKQNLLKRNLTFTKETEILSDRQIKLFS